MSKNDGNTVVEELITKVREFLRERDWEKYHNPKDLAVGICVEAAELLQLFQWIKPEESEQYKKNPSKMKRIKEELADVAIYCLSMANTLEIDLASAILEKLEQNKKKYPADKYKGEVSLNS